MRKRLLKIVLVVVSCCLYTAPGSGCLPADRTTAALSSLITGGSPNLPYDPILGDNSPGN